MNPDSRTTSADSVLPTSTNSSQSSSAALIIDPEAVLAHDSRRRPPPRIRLFRWFRDVVVPWVQGPDPPVDVAFKPLFPNVQEWPSEVVERFIKTSRMKVLALVIYFLTWVVTFGIVVHYSRFADEISGQRPQEQLSCNAAFWYGPHLDTRIWNLTSITIGVKIMPVELMASTADPLINVPFLSAALQTVSSPDRS